VARADYVELRAPDNPKIGRMKVLLAEGSPTLSGGIGGWEAVPRPGRRPLTVWRGPQEPLRLTLPIIFDRLAEGRNGGQVEDDIRLLEKMAGLDAGDPEPPKLIVEGELPHDYSRARGNRWVIESITWGEAIRRPGDGKRVRQIAEVVLMLYTADDRLERIDSPSRPGRYRYVRARRGDTFARIAARELGSRRHGTRLARLNGRRSADVELRAGRRVKLPGPELLADWNRDLRR
jgi:hypothetical protein